jgi:hemoglobin-like flavoprotein
MTDLNNQPQSIRDQVALLSFIEDILKEKNDSTIKPEALPQVKAALLKELNYMINTHMVHFTYRSARIKYSFEK